MNNEAFQKLVRDRAQIRSTKEIAREAVESEFRQQRRRRRRNDDDDSDDEDRRPARNTKQRATTNIKEETKTEPGNYRDRAKERREGKEAVGEDLESLVASLPSATAPAPPRKESSSDESTFDNLLPSSAQQARQLLIEQRLDAQSTLGRQMLDWLRQTWLEDPTVPPPLSNAGRLVQRTTLTMTLAADPRNRGRAWEVPVEQSFGSGSMAVKASPVDEALLVAIERALLRKFHQERAVSRVEWTKEAKKKKRTNVLEEDEHKSSSEDDDDDIFDNVGDDYVPDEAVESAEPTSDAPTTRRTKIFDTVEAAVLVATVPTQHVGGDDDDSGDDVEDMEHSGSNPKAAQRLQGLSNIDAYDGMEETFEGDEQRKKKKKNSRKKAKRKGSDSS